MERKGDWMVTYSGIKFYPLGPLPSEVFIRDISHALSNICRFTGHVKEFYSVAQHSVLVSQLLDGAELRMMGLLHDAHEAYLADISRPVKRSLSRNNGIFKAAGNLDRVIFSKFGIFPSFEMYRAIHAADGIMLLTEGRDLMEGGTRDWHDGGYQALDTHIEPLLPKDAEALFLKHYFLITAERQDAIVMGRR